MRSFIRSVALIQLPTEDRCRWFSVWNEDRQYLDFVVGLRRNDQESFRDCIVRAIRDRLLLNTRDFLVSNMAQLNSEFSATLPGDSEPSRVAVAFYLVNLYGKTARSTLDRDSHNRWLTSAEVLDGTSD